MSITSNAKTTAQKNIVNEYLATLGDDAEFTDGSINFGKGQSLVLAVEGEDQIGFKSYAEFRAHFSGEEAGEAQDDSDNPSQFPEWVEAVRAQLGQLGEDPEVGDDDNLKPLFKDGKTPGEAAEAIAREQEAIRIKTKADAEERARREKIIAEATVALDKQVEALANDIRRERTGELQQNEARYQKGEHLVRLEDLGQRLREAGDTRFRSNKAVLEFAREQIHSAMEHQGVIDTALGRRLSDQEVSATRTVYRTYLSEQGLNTTFRLIDTINPETGQPYQDDAGNPPELPIKGIALNKLYILAKMYNPDDKDTIISFAYRTGEKALSAAKKLMDSEQDNAAEVIQEIKEYLDSNPVNADGEPYGSADEAIIDFVAHRLGKAAPSAVKSIKVDAGFFSGTWTEIKQIATALFKHQQFPLDDKGEAGNTQILERLVNTAFADFDESEEGQVRAVAQLFVDGEDITEAQATSFVEAYFSEGEEGKEADEREPVEA